METYLFCGEILDAEGHGSSGPGAVVALEYHLGFLVVAHKHDLKKQNLVEKQHACGQIACQLGLRTWSKLWSEFPLFLPFQQSDSHWNFVAMRKYSSAHVELEMLMNAGFLRPGRGCNNCHCCRRGGPPPPQKACQQRRGPSPERRSQPRKGVTLEGVPAQRGS